jgi:hypothetical protein
VQHTVFWYQPIFSSTEAVQAAPTVFHITLLPLLSSTLVLRRYAFGTIYTHVAVHQFLFKFKARKQNGRYQSQKMFSTEYFRRRNFIVFNHFNYEFSVFSGNAG